jgi:hypothetical protein
VKKACHQLYKNTEKPTKLDGDLGVPPQTGRQKARARGYGSCGKRLSEVLFIKKKHSVRLNN